MSSVRRRRGGTVIVTSHYLEEIEALAQRAIVIGNGRVLADGTVAAIRDTVVRRRVTVTLPDGIPDVPGVLSTERDGERTHLFTADADRLVRDLVAAQVQFKDLEVRPTSLEEAFLTITAA